MSVKLYIGSDLVEIVGQFRTKAQLFRRGNEDDEMHKKALVNPSYENPGYVDMDEDDASFFYDYLDFGSFLTRF